MKLTYLALKIQVTGFRPRKIQYFIFYHFYVQNSLVFAAFEDSKYIAIGFYITSSSFFTLKNIYNIWTIKKHLFLLQNTKHFDINISQQLYLSSNTTPDQTTITKICDKNKLVFFSIAVTICQFCILLLIKCLPFHCYFKLIDLLRK